MNSRLFGIAIIACALSFSLLLGGTQPARAACTDDLVVAQAEVDQMTDATKKQAAQAALEEAKKAAAAGDEATCTDRVHVARAAAKR